LLFESCSAETHPEMSRGIQQNGTDVTSGTDCRNKYSTNESARHHHTTNQGVKGAGAPKLRSKRNFCFESQLVFIFITSDFHEPIVKLTASPHAADVPTARSSQATATEEAANVNGAAGNLPQKTQDCPVRGTGRCVAPLQFKKSTCSHRRNGIQQSPLRDLSKKPNTHSQQSKHYTHRAQEGTWRWAPVSIRCRDSAQAAHCSRQDMRAVESSAPSKCSPSEEAHLQLMISNTSKMNICKQPPTFLKCTLNSEMIR